MRIGSFNTPLDGEGEKVEVDETFIGQKKGAEVKRGASHKMAARPSPPRETGATTSSCS